MILVVGATGNLGGAVTRALLTQGKSVRILARTKSNYQPLVDAGTQAVFGDLKVRASLDPLCQGIETIITTANSALRGGDDNPETVDWQGNRNLIDAAKAAQVKQFIFISASSADPRSPVPFLAAKGKTEEYLQASRIPYTIIAPNAFMEVWPAMVVGLPALQGKPVYVAGTGTHKHSFISVADVISFILCSIGNPSAINKRLVIGGPEPLSFRDAATVYERVLGHPVTVNSVPLGQPVPGLAEGMQPLVASFEAFDSPMEMKELTQTFGVQLTPLEQAVRRMIAKQ
ncbi:MAG: SDR family oxidoreductase [Chloroflexi bacterium]|nr:SDR family oxidoreductase [Chloroflexota bacterium]